MTLYYYSVIASEVTFSVSVSVSVILLTRVTSLRSGE